MPIGFLLVDKPVGISSFQVVSRLRRVTGEKRIGFAGTLDPFASGLLVLAIGRQYTRMLDVFTNLDKTYEAVMTLGTRTDTLDPEGTVLESRPLAQSLDGVVADMRREIPSFIGPITQEIPAFSAKKVSGTRLYAMARKGLDTPISFKQVDIVSLEILSVSEPSLVSYVVTCSKGTYVRQITVDLAMRVNEIAYTSALRRTAVGPYLVSDALSVEAFSLDAISEKVFTSVFQGAVRG